jgi:DUF177 domain-containing protein
MLNTIDVRELLRHPGVSREEPIRGTVDGLATELVRVPDDELVAADLVLESVVEGIVVSGHVGGTWLLRCARCLTEFDRPFDVTVSELFVPSPDEDADAYPLGPDGELDPDQMVRDAVGVEMPFSPLCRPDCKGLCEICGGNRNLGECPGHAEVDPRFAVLSDLFPDLPDTD